MTTKLVVIVLVSHVFLVPALLVAAVGAWLANFYLKAQLSVKREMRSVPAFLFPCFALTAVCSNAKAPVLAHFGAAIAGLSTVTLTKALYVF